MANGFALGGFAQGLSSGLTTSSNSRAKRPLLMAERTLCLITSPHIEKSDRFDAFLDGEFVVTSRQPRLDGARELLRRGYSPDTLMTTRAHDRGYDSFIPAPIGELARWTIVEEDKNGLRRRLWQPHPNAFF